MVLQARGRLLRAATFLMVAGATAFAAPAWARTNHALLVAVTAYPNLPPKASLVGPNNDAVLVRDYLTTSAPVPFDAANVTVLADGVEGAAGSPTLAGIEAALAGVADKVGEGDFVYLHFSGHGAQQPAADPGLEPDGLDEIFLPADTGLWKNKNEGVPNALRDKVIGGALQKIRDKGAFVWIVIDACHSGTATRAVGITDEDVSERKVEAADLGIPEAEIIASVSDAGGATRGMADEARESAFTVEEETGAKALAPGGMVAFFAAQTVETTPEMVLPRGDPEGRKLGLFTYTLMSKLAENPNVTYRQLAQGVLQAYSGDNRTRPTPLFEGQLDTRVFDMTGGEVVPQWPLEAAGSTLSIPAGSLHRLTPGTRLAILNSPAAPIEQALGYVEVKSARNLRSTLAPVAYDDKPVLTREQLPPNAYARLAELAVDFKLTIARPAPSGDYAADVGLLNAALDAIAADSEIPVSFDVVDHGQPADIRLAVMSEMDVGIMEADREDASRASLSTNPAIWFLPPTGEISVREGRRPPSIRLRDEAGSNLGAAGTTPGREDPLTRRIAENLVLMYRATNLSRLSAISDFKPQDFEVAFKIKPAETDEMTPLAAGDVPIVHPGDQVHLEGRNASNRAVDINVLYIGSDYSISHMYAERMHGGSEIDIPLLEFTDSSFGMERMVVVLTEGRPQTPVEDLSFLQQVGVRNLTRAVGGPQGFTGLLQDIASAPATRAAAAISATKDAGPKGAVMIFPLETTPRAN